MSLSSGIIIVALYGDVPSLEPLARLILDHLEWPDIIIMPRVGGLLLLVGMGGVEGGREQEEGRQGRRGRTRRSRRELASGGGRMSQAKARSLACVCGGMPACLCWCMRGWGGLAWKEAQLVPLPARTSHT